MTLKTQCKPAYRFLSEAQIKAIHQATLEVLETTGVRVSHEEGIQLLKYAGCSIRDENIVQIPNWLVEESIRSAPSGIAIYNRKGEGAMQLEGHHSYYGLGTDLITTYDLERVETRPSLLKDVANAARVADYCEEIDFIASFALPGDVHTNLTYIACVKAQMENSTKPIFFTAAGAEDLAFIIKMGAAAAGGDDALREKPFIIHYSEPTSPLTHSRGAVSKLLLCAQKGIPICYTPAAMLGGSAPVTLPGGIVQANAEALSGIVLHQLKRRGAPIISGFALPPLDMRTSCVVYAAPELRMANSAFADLLHHYQLPMWSSAGSDAHTIDAQASMEHAFTTLMAALDGANLIHDVAYLGQGLLGHPAMIVMCAEIVSYVKRIIKGFDISPEMMGLDTIHKVGPGGNYLTEDHTLRHFRSEIWRPRFLNRDNPDTWREKGIRRYEDIVIAKTLEILETHQPERLPDEVQAMINEILCRAEEELEGIQFVA